MSDQASATAQTDVTEEDRSMSSHLGPTESQWDQLSSMHKTASTSTTHRALSGRRPGKTAPIEDIPTPPPREVPPTAKERKADERQRKKKRTGELARALKERPTQLEGRENPIDRNNQARDKREPVVMYGGVFGMAL